MGIRPALVVDRPWVAWQIALLVLGCLLAFLLLCLLIYCCVWCCCFRGAPFCCLPCCLPCCVGRAREKPAMLASSYDVRAARHPLTEGDESQSGFRDASRKPNYVVSTISKSSAHSAAHQQLDCLTDLNTHHNAHVIHSASSSCLHKTTLLEQLQQQDLIDIHLPHEDTKLYRSQAPDLDAPKSHHRPQVYSSINNPIDYGSTYNTNEGFLNDHSDLHQVRFSSDVLINDADLFDADAEPFHRYPAHHLTMDPSALCEDAARNKQYYSTNYTHHTHTELTHNASFVKYDSDV